jgi:hypothetical protein
MMDEIQKGATTDGDFTDNVVEPDLPGSIFLVFVFGGMGFGQIRPTEMRSSL